MDDKQIVDLYWERSETAISETSKKYGKSNKRHIIHLHWCEYSLSGPLIFFTMTKIARNV